MKKLLLANALLIVMASSSAQTFKSRTIELCNKKVNPYGFSAKEIDGKMFKFNISGKGCPALPGYQVLNFDSCDVFSIVFAGHRDKLTQTPTYYIKRKDGKYLSPSLDGAEFRPLIKDSRLQKWMFVKVADNTYNLIAEYNLCWYLNFTVNKGTYYLKTTKFSSITSVNHIDLIIKEDVLTANNPNNTN